MTARNDGANVAHSADVTTPPRPELAVGAVAIDGDELLMIRRGSEPGLGQWSLPGGRVEPGETTAEAVTRELQEETGLSGVCGPMVGWVERISEDHHFVILDFEVIVLDRSDPRAGDDAAEVRWVPLHEVTELDTVSGLVEFLADHGILATLV